MIIDLQNHGSCCKILADQCLGRMRPSLWFVIEMVLKRSSLIQVLLRKWKFVIESSICSTWYRTGLQLRVNGTTVTETEIGTGYIIFESLLIYRSDRTTNHHRIWQKHYKRRPHASQARSLSARKRRTVHDSIWFSKSFRMLYTKHEFGNFHRPVHVEQHVVTIDFTLY